MKPILSLTPVVQNLLELIEGKYRKRIIWLEQKHRAGDKTIGSRVDPDGTPCMAYQQSSIIDDLSMSHELLHLWRWSTGVPVVNASLAPEMNGQLSYIQNQCEHLWIYSVQEAPPFSMHPWNKPHSGSTARKRVAAFRKNPDLDLSLDVAFDVNLSRPTEQQVYRQELAEISSEQARRVEKILRVWTWDNIDSANGAAKTYLTLLETAGIDVDAIGLCWQTLGDAGTVLLRIETPMPTYSTSDALVRALS